MPATGKGVPYPAAGDSNDVSAHLQALAEWVDLNPGVRAMTTAQRDALTGGELYEGRLIVNLSTGRAERRVGSGWQPAVPTPTPADIGAAPASHGVHGVSSVNGRTGAVTGLAESSHGVHGVSSVNGRTGDVTGLAESSHTHAAVISAGSYAGNDSSVTVNLPFRPRLVHIAGGGMTGTMTEGSSSLKYITYNSTPSASTVSFASGGGIFSNGFTVPASVGTSSGFTYQYVAYA